MKKTSRELGQQAEIFAAELLVKQGLTLLEQNVTFRVGELDLIMKDKDSLVFVEVKRRKKDKFGGALEKVQQVLSHIIEAKITVESQNPEGSRTHYDATATVKTSKNQLIYTASGWDILKIADELSRKLEAELPKHDDNRQKDSIRKKEY